MKLLARRIRPNEVEQEVTQRDQFNTDAVGLAETLVRESLQNSMDGRIKPTVGPVRTRIRILESRHVDGELWNGIFGQLIPHLRVSGVNLEGVDLARPKLLCIEDFGTTGLLGSADVKDNRNFSDFWRRTGRSHKGGEDSGRWGLGKLVFSSASTLRTFFGLTVRSDDEAREQLLMGQAVLRNHRIDGPPVQDFAPHAFFAVEGEDGLQVPERDPDFVKRFAAACGFERTSEPGLSIAVPFVHPDITAAAILPFVVRNWFFPILTEHLVVDIDGLVIDKGSFTGLAAQYGGPDFTDGKLAGFITAMHDARNQDIEFVLADSWTDVGVEAAFPEGKLELAREIFLSGKLVAVRAPLTIRPQSGSAQRTHVDLYLQSTPEGGRGEALYVRGAITIPGEARRFRGRNCLGALVASDKTAAAFLGDAEGPAHTTWSGTAEKVRENWKNPVARLKEIRDALNLLYEAIAHTGDRTDPDALKNIFFVNTSGTTPTLRKKNPLVLPLGPPPIPRSSPVYRIQQRTGGFAVRSTAATKLPLSFSVQVAYDVAAGKALSQYKEYDFKLADADIGIVATGASAVPSGSAGNVLEIVANEPEFSVVVTGFDANRDLFVRAGDPR